MKEMENAYTYTLEASKLSKYKILGMDFMVMMVPTINIVIDKFVRRPAQDWWSKMDH